MNLSYLRNILFLQQLLAALSHCSDLVQSGDAITTRYWDCCKPSCSWAGKAHFSQPVLSCDKGDNPLKDFTQGTGCNGGTAYSCTNQSPWAVNDTFSYGFAGVYLVKDKVEDAWCCSCYQLKFTSGPVKGKTMIIQAHNTAYDVNTANRFSLGIPGGNTSSIDACANEFSVSQSVFGQPGSGVTNRSDCDNLPDAMKPGCQWRFDWFEDALYPTATYERVLCPSDLTNKTGCIRDDEKQLAAMQTSSPSASSSPSSGVSLLPALFTWTTVMIIAGFFSI